MIGTKTVEIASSSRTEGWSKQATPFSKNVSRSLQGTAVIGASQMLSLPSTQQIVLMQGYMNRPIMADAPRWFLDKEMTKKCQIPASPCVPYWVVAQREDSDVSALQGLIDIEEDAGDEIDQEMDEYYDEDYDIEDLEDEDEGDEDEDEEDEDYDDEDYEDFIEDEYDEDDK